MKIMQLCSAGRSDQIATCGLTDPCKCRHTLRVCFSHGTKLRLHLFSLHISGDMFCLFTVKFNSEHVFGRSLSNDGSISVVSIHYIYICPCKLHRYISSVNTHQSPLSVESRELCKLIFRRLYV